MRVELQALEDNHTWEIVSLPPDKKSLASMWVYRVKYKPDGTVERYKARLVAKGYKQTQGVDFHESFSPIAKVVTVRLLLAIGSANNWDIHQIDVNNAYLHGTIDEDVYLAPPEGLLDTCNWDQLRTQMASSSGTANAPPAEIGDIVKGFFTNVGVSASIPENLQFKDAYSQILSQIFKADNIQRGRISCVFSVVPAVANFYKGLHGGALAAIAERVAIACARTVVAEDKEIFLGELSISYLSAAPKDEVLMVDATVLRSGRNLTVVGMEFRVKKNGKLAFTARATFYNMPVAKL